jgi:hypothetical protein
MHILIITLLIIAALIFWGNFADNIDKQIDLKNSPHPDQVDRLVTEKTIEYTPSCDLRMYLELKDGEVYLRLNDSITILENGKYLVEKTWRRLPWGWHGDIFTEMGKN